MYTREGLMSGIKLSPLTLASKLNSLPHRRLSIKLGYDLHSCNKPQFMMIIIIYIVHHQYDLLPKKLSLDKCIVIMAITNFSAVDL